MDICQTKAQNKKGYLERRRAINGKHRENRT